MAIRPLLVMSLHAMATITAVAHPVDTIKSVRARAIAAGPSIDMFKPDNDGAKNIAGVVGDVTGVITGIPMGTGAGAEAAGAMPGDMYGTPADAYDLPEDAYDAYGYPEDVYDEYGYPEDVYDLPADAYDLPADAYDLPDGDVYSTPTNYDEEPSRTSPQYSKMTIGCRAKGCDSVVKVYDLAMPVPTHSCPRDALAALAKWRLFCDRPPKVFNNLIQTEPNCWSRAPSIDRCCGEWVDLDDPKYKDYPSRYIPMEKGFADDTYVASWIPEMGDHGDRRIIKPGWHEYNVKTDKCQFWRPEDELEFAYFINTLPNYGIWDVDETGKIWGQTAWNAEGVSPGSLIPGSDSEMDLSKAVGG
ncbi:hypothetical protein Z517_06749 [Fonsecaea pedrosoi CBS 271.37]|uniref:Uncharacterized protein n=1 Tax=Fonsecaea pedrosoi CBS 271.37 TaxID=1442368 RepID=A0A0D2H678_9EURO|nr:uncharacterized protein Z517_06749 [Fonsecaea pedrosoi CBS 271.37]KIW80134.1 hypothetical protein Z517_06749 [Fonsecaea pedrosoi CBS 271.37]